MLLETILFELRYQLKSPAFWTSLIVFFVFSFGAMCIPSVHLSSTNIVLKNGSFPILIIHAVLSIFSMFSAVAIAGDVIVRDQNTGFGPMIYTTRLSKGDYVFGRILGAYLACAIAFAAVPLGLWLGTIMPWVDPESMRPFTAQPYLFGYAVLGLPTIFFLVALFSGLSAMTRSIMSSYMGALALFVLYALSNAFLTKDLEITRWYSIIQPFGITVLARITSYWTSVECNSSIPNCDGDLMANRFVCLAGGIAIMLLTSAALKLDSTRVRQPRKRLGRADISSRDGKSDTTSQPVLPHPKFDGGSAFMFWTRTKFECRQIFFSPSFIALAALCVFFAAISENTARKLFGTDVYPVTRLLLHNLSGTQLVFTLIFSTFYGGELVWRERDARIDEIIDATPIPNWAYLFPKVLALFLILTFTLLLLVTTDIGVQISKSYTNFEIGKYAVWFVAPQMVQCSIMAATGILTQVLAPRKFIGWAIILGCLVLQLVPGILDTPHPLIEFGSFPDVPLSDMNGEGQFWIERAWLQLYWGSLAVLMLCLSNLFWRRGVSTSLKSRLKMLPVRATKATRILLATALSIFIGAGCYVFYNINVLNEYVSTTEDHEQDAHFENEYRDIANKPQPSIVDIKLTVDLFPHELRFLSRGTYTLQNQTSSPIPIIYVDFPYDVHYKELMIGQTVAKPVEPHYWIKQFVCIKPMLPGETRTMTFDSEYHQQGFSYHGLPKHIVDNGTLMLNGRFAPLVGIHSAELMTDKTLRRQYKLPPLQRMRRLTDSTANDVSYTGGSWSKADITVSTVADQTPFAPGKKVSDKVEDGRRIARFVSDQKILSNFTVQSAHYQERHRMHNGVDLGVYYDAQHSTNVNRILDALAAALDYCQKNFGAFQFPSIAVLEFPDYGIYAQSLAGTIPFSEGLGFIADIRDPKKVDYVTFVTAHELSHQWWAHQIIGADKQGATMLSETLAQYTALMVMEKLCGPAQVHKFLEYELNNYLKARQFESVEEQPLYKVENQTYIHYNKGSMVMYLLKDRIGEEAVNRALRNLLKAYKFKGPPYPSSTDLVALLRQEAAPKDQELITDLFENITIYDFRAKDTKVKVLPDGRFSVSVLVAAYKAHANGKGEETSADINEPVDIGFFTSDPSKSTFSEKDVLLIEKKQLKWGPQWVSVTLDKRPVYAGIDPYCKWIDKYSPDNIVKVKD